MPPEEVELMTSPPTAASQPKQLSPSNTDLKQQKSDTPEPPPEQKTSSKELKHKASTSSLNSLTKAKWLSWNSANKTDSLLEGREDLLDEEESSNGLDQPQPEDFTEDEPQEQISGGPQLGSSEQTDKLSDVSQRKKLWSFWSASEEQKEKNTMIKNMRATNKILTSTPSLPSKEDLLPKSNQSKTEAVESRGDIPENTENDDAVLYKPQDSAKEFNKINTHKNENLTENVLVPDWDTCLKQQPPSSTFSTSLNSLSNNLMRGGQTFDIKYWKSYLSQISHRLGLSSAEQELNKTADDDDSSQRTNRSGSEQGLDFLLERSYKLYGKSLSRLPKDKRACLPNFNKAFSSSENAGPSKSRTQLEDDAEDKNSISITNDAMGNLLINSADLKSKPASSDIIQQKVGPLRKVKRVLIIGVHGFFPTKMIRPLIGAPKGTSLKFANEAEKAVLRYFVDNGMINDHESHDMSIQKIALEKEGKIIDRVEFFSNIMTKWKDELNMADFIFIASHSQGCVVSIILLAHLIQNGILERPAEKRLGILGMAGVNNGPFYGIDKTFFMKAYSAIEHDSLMELFELTKFDSPQSLAYKEAIQTIISVNVKICLVGSINDQLVPLYSALASHVFHPNIYRACYIDHATKTPLFIRTLISLCCQLQNMGYFDNNVLKELSPILAGPITGSGHSKIYNDGKVYDLGLKFILDTDDLVIPRTPSAFESTKKDVMLSQLPVTNSVYLKEFNVGKIGTNPYVLPWCLRGLVFNVEKNWREAEPQITLNPKAKSGRDEINMLYELFDQWKPDTKALRDLKFRLNGIRASKL